ncbi:MAG: GWxTD domain-containing protein [Candidatus Delongbacteria bacterium]|nr:GWxTD domain-containing protein [Candidatus Delongbacteria bacterium]
MRILIVFLSLLIPIVMDAQPEQNLNPDPDSLWKERQEFIADSLLKETTLSDSALCRHGKRLFDLHADKGAEKVFKSLLERNYDPMNTNRVLGEIFLRKPLEKIILLTSLKKLFDIDNFSIAVKHFKSMVALRPDSVVGYYHLGKAYLTKTNPDDYRTGLEWTDQGIAISRTYRDILMIQAVYYYYLNRSSLSIRTLLDYLTINKQDAGRVYYYIALNYQNLNDPAKCTQYYYRAMDSLSNPELAEREIRFLYPLLSDSEAIEITKLPISGQGLYIKNFWLKNDSDFKTPANERLMEHLGRCKMVRENYHTQLVPHGFDDRGKIIIIHGKPDKIFRSSAAENNVLPNESWMYKVDEQEMVFDFVKFENVYYLARSLKDAVRSYSESYRILPELYRERSHIAMQYEKVSNRLLSFQNMRINQTMMFDLDQIDNQYVQDKTLTEQALTRDVSQVGGVSNYFSFLSQFYQFAGDSGMTRLDFHFALPTERLNIIRSDEYFGQIQLTIILLAENLNDHKIYRIETEKNFRFSKPEDISYYSVFKDSYRLKPGPYNLVLSIKDNYSNRSGIFRRKVTIQDFRQTLLTSDILISIFNDPKSEKTMENLSPYPFTVIKKSNRNYVYFEIHNLRELSDYNTYLVSYRIYSTKPKTNVLKKIYNQVISPIFGVKPGSVEVSIDRQGRGNHSREFFLLDMKHVPAGECLLRIRVKDNLSDQETVKEYPFTLKN